MNKRIINILFITISILTTFLLISNSASAQCVTDPDCDDSNPCTDDACVLSVCEYTNNSAACDDGDACTTSDTCSAGTCVGGAPPNCDDANVCTDDSCDPASGCVNTNNTVACDDGDACTTSDTCSAGTCVGGAPPNCDDANVCTDDSCDPASGCVNTAIVHTVSLFPDPLNLGTPGEQGVITALVEENSVAVAGEAVTFSESTDPNGATDLYPMAELDINGEAVVTIHGLQAGTGTLSVTAVDMNGNEIAGVNYTLGIPLDSLCATLSGSVLTIGAIAPCDTEMTVICDDGVNPIVGYLIATIDPPSTAVTVEVTPVTDSAGEALLLVKGTAEGQATVDGSVNCGSGAAIVNVTECGDAADCDDGAFCNGAETCVGGSCQAGTDPCVPPKVCDEVSDTCGTTTTTTVVVSGVCTSDVDCDDGEFCNGAETCDLQAGCQTGSNPCTDDGDFCNGIENCNETTDSCESSGNPCTDDGAFCNGNESCNEDVDQCVSSGDPCAADEICIEESDTCEPAIGIEATFTGCGMPFLVWFGNIQIQGFETDFDLTSVVSYDSPLVFKLSKLLNPTGDTINQVVFLLPSIFFPAWDYPVTVTVTVDELSDTVDIPSCIQ